MTTNRPLPHLLPMALAAFLLMPAAPRTQSVSGFVEVRASEAAGVEGP